MLTYFYKFPHEEVFNFVFPLNVEGFIINIHNKGGLFMTRPLEMMFTVDDIIHNFEYSFNETVREHQKTLFTLTVEEAMEELSRFFNENKYGCCIYAVNEFCKKFPEATFGYLPEENPYDNNKRTSYKVIAIVGDEVYDIVYGMEHQKDIFTRNCRIDVYSYANMNLQEGESLVMLPNPHYFMNNNFIEYFFHNEKSRCIGSVLHSNST